MIIQHPTQPGWLIATPEVQRLLNAPHKLILPDGSQVHPLFGHKPDFTDADVEAAREYALAYVRSEAAARIEASDDGLINIQYVYDEVRRYDAYLSDPANEPTPNAARYKVASEVATALSVSLTAVLDNFRSRWIASYTAAAAIVAERQRVVTALNVAVDVAEIETVLAGISW